MATTVSPIDFSVEELTEIDERAEKSDRTTVFQELAGELDTTPGRVSASYYRAKRAAGHDIDAEAEAAEVAEADGGDGELFSATDYDDPKLKLYTPDGARVDAIAINFGGDSSLDRSDPEDVALIRSLELGSKGTVTIRFEVDNLAYGHRRRQDRTETVNKVKLGLGEIMDITLDQDAGE